MKKALYVLSLSLLVCVACSKDEQNLEEQTIKETESLTAARGGQPKIQICHYDAQNGTWKIINPSNKSLDAHLEHGDIQLIDVDGDGYVTEVNECVPGGDCDDNNPSINPDALEVCADGIDNDCNGTIDENCCPSGGWCGTINQLGFFFDIEVLFSDDCSTVLVEYIGSCPATWTLNSVSGNVYTYLETNGQVGGCIDNCIITIVDNGSTLDYSYTCAGGGFGPLSPCQL